MPLRTIVSDFVAAESEGGRYRAKILIQVAAEMGGIVGVDRHHRSLVQHSPQRVFGEVVDHAALSNRSQKLVSRTLQCSTRYRRHRFGTPLSWWTPRSSKRIPDCDINSLTALETSTSPARAFAATRAPM